MLMIATVIEGRLLGINPYGQPGVEQYKKNMNKKKRQTRVFTIVIAMAAALVATPNVLASTGSETGGHGHGIATIFLWVAVLLVLAEGNMEVTLIHADGDEQVHMTSGDILVWTGE